MEFSVAFVWNKTKKIKNFKINTKNEKIQKWKIKNEKWKMKNEKIKIKNTKIENTKIQKKTKWTK